MGPYTHAIDPIIADVGGIYLWWYGLSYALGFLEMHWFMSRARRRLGLSRSDVYTFTLLFGACVLAGGRLVEVAFDEWPLYQRRPQLIPALWLGGMATHGLLLGAGAAVGLFSRVRGVPFRVLADAVVIPGAFLLGVGRIGNFLDGQIVGSATDVWWAVKFPDTDGFRHPVVLYDGAKNLLLVPLLLWVRRTHRMPGATAAHFVFWYAFLRIFVDLFRDYPTHRLAFGTGQTLNVLMTIVGFALLCRSYRRRHVPETGPFAAAAPAAAGLLRKRVALAALLLFSLTIPSNWTQDIPARYARRHPGLRYSILYPPIPTAVPRTSALPGAAASERRQIPASALAIRE